VVVSRCVAALTAAVSIAAVVAACAFGGPGGSGMLEGTSWTVVSIAGAPTIAEARPTMAFAAEGDVRGTSGCNLYRATYHTTGDAIAIGELASTEMACDPARNAQEQAFTLALTSVTSWRIADDGSLELGGASAIVAQATDVEPTGAVAPPELPGTSWTLVDLAGETVAVSPTIAFGADGTVSGSAGCNTFNGTYTIDGSAVSFGPLATTRMACPDDVMSVEDAFLLALDGAASWSIGGDGRLVLDGETALTFDPS
jgi:heat shock protein HslJ